MLLDVHAVDHHRAEIDRAEIATESLCHLSLRRGDEATAHCASTRAARRQIRRQRLQRSRVAAGRNTDEHLLDGALVQRILGTERGLRRQLNLVTIERSQRSRPWGRRLVDKPQDRMGERRCL